MFNVFSKLDPKQYAGNSCMKNGSPVAYQNKYHQLIRRSLNDMQSEPPIMSKIL